jgi:hypothetical protein
VSLKYGLPFPDEPRPVNRQGSMRLFSVLGLESRFAYRFLMRFLALSILTGARFLPAR